MDWHDLDPASQAWVAYIEAELARVLPAGFRWQRTVLDVKRQPAQRLGDCGWLIVPPRGRSAGEQNFLLKTSPDGRLFVLTYGNTDAGPQIRCWRQAAVLEMSLLRYCPLGKMVLEVVKTKEPDVHGLT